MEWNIVVHHLLFWLFLSCSSRYLHLFRYQDLIPFFRNAVVTWWHPMPRFTIIVSSAMRDGTSMRQLAHPFLRYHYDPLTISDRCQSCMRVFNATNPFLFYLSNNNHELRPFPDNRTVNLSFQISAALMSTSKRSSRKSVLSYVRAQIWWELEEEWNRVAK